MIHYVVGDATRPHNEGSKYILHICNNFGAWGAGFVTALSRRWRDPEKMYREWANSGEEGFRLGNIQTVKVEDDIRVVNMIAQSSKTDLEALKTCLKKVEHLISSMRFPPTIHMPRIGCGIGGRTWEEIEPLITSCLRGYKVYVYDLPKL